MTSLPSKEEDGVGGGGGGKNLKGGKGDLGAQAIFRAPRSRDQADSGDLGFREN